ncbi:MAG: 6-phosphogluconolactonase [Chromatocurvus sp.]
MNGGVDARVFPSQGELAPALAAAIAEQLRSAILARGQAILAVSGGSTPVPFFKALQRAELDWSRVTVTLVDERWVDADHADSNAALVNRHLLRGAAAGARFEPLKTPAATAEQGCQWVNSRLALLGPPDIAVLGMGADGHTASWFPGASSLAQALDPASRETCVALQPPQAEHARLSLSLAAVLAATRLYLHFTGSAKWATFERALLPGPVADLPVRALLRQQSAPVQVCYAVHDTLPEDTA